ncbi:MAG: hypothetical protein NVV74_02035 [Magnetospirillum sp.]|nr:hypothetical protein [Magnetospirillum sp.]
MTVRTQPDVAATVTRTLALALPADDVQISRLAATEGVLAVLPSPDGRRLKVTYDVRGMVMDALEKVVVSLGLKPSGGMVARLSRAWAGFQDDNLRSQAKLVHNCCNVPPQP